MKTIHKFLLSSLLIVAIMPTAWSNRFATHTDTLDNDMVTSAPQQEYVKVIKKEFAITPTGKTNISNLYGKVNIRTWDKNLVNIKVTITVNANDMETAKTILNRISINFANDNDNVSAKTVIQSSEGSSIWGWFSGSNSNNNYQIDYDVYMPKTNSLALSNKYGDSFVERMDGKANVNIRYGNIRMDNVCNSLNANIAYGDGTFVKTENVDAVVSYGKARFIYAQNIDVNSGYSEIVIEQAADVRSNSKYDEYDLGLINSLIHNGSYGDVHISYTNSIVANADYTDFKVDKLGKSGVFETDYGDIVIEKISKDFTKFVLDGDYGDCRLKVEEGAQYELDAQGSYFNATYPRSLRVSSKSDDNSSSTINGNMGNGKSSIKVRLDYGSLKVN